MAILDMFGRQIEVGDQVMFTQLTNRPFKVTKITSPLAISAAPNGVPIVTVEAVCELQIGMQAVAANLVTDMVIVIKDIKQKEPLELVPASATTQ